MQKVDRTFLFISIILTLLGFVIFISAALGVLARETIQFSAILFNQAFFGLFLGSIALLVAVRVHYKTLRKYALVLVLSALGLSLLVFVPGVGFSSGGAQRWLLLGPFSFQPAEFLKIAVVIYSAAWITLMKDKIQTFAYGIIPLLIILGVIGAVLLSQPDTSSFIVIFLALFAMFIVAGGTWRDVAIVSGVGLVTLSFLILTKPYIRDRFMTYIQPTGDPLGSGYQIQQSLIAIGSGGIFGRGFGQSVQKFDYLPEPIGDSIFAVAAEEFGFMGSIVIITLFLVFAFRGFRIAIRAPDRFSGLLVVGIVILIVSQSFMNIASMLGIFPLTGTPLLFISHGGTALFFTLFEVGIILGISRYRLERARA